MTIWKPELKGGKPRYKALADALAGDVARGRLKAGDRLPTHRELAWALGVTVGTVSRGYAEADRNVLDPRLEETVKELSTIDGAFILHGEGTVNTCGAILKTASQDVFELPRGLGARHHAAAAITAVTDSLAITVSESTGTVCVFRGGGMVLEIEKPRTPKVHPEKS